MGTLFVIGTPIGNLEDLTYRAARVLGQVSLLAAEDTRVTVKLLNHLELRVPLTSYHQHNQQAKLPALLKALEAGDVALVTDAGMPGISDPGAELVAQAAAAGHRVEVIPGVSAVTTALAASGMPGDSFLFVGFLPRRGKDRRDHLDSLTAVTRTLVFFEAPHRLKATLGDLLKTLGDRPVAVARELTKLHEEVFRGTLSQALEYFDAPRGELALVVAGAEPVDGTEDMESDLAAAREQLVRLRQEGARANQAVAEVVAASGLPRNTVYQLWVESAKSG